MTSASGFYVHGITLRGRSSFDMDVDQLDETSPRAPQPQCNVAFRPHQLALLKRCTEYEAGAMSLSRFPSLGANVNPSSTIRTEFAVIADRVGAGKSYVILALVHTHDITTNDTPLVTTVGFNRVTFKTRDPTRVIKTSVLVIPHNLANQWWTYVQSYGSIQNYKMINKQKLLNELLEDAPSIEGVDLVIVTTTYFRAFLNRCIDMAVKFQRVIFDECDTISLTGCTSIPARFVWGVTASYGNLLYPRGFNHYDYRLGRFVWSAEGIHSTGYVRNFFNDIDYKLPLELSKLLVVKNSDAFVDASMNLPPVITHTIACLTPITINVLNGVVDKNVIASLNAGDTQGAINLINPANRGSQDNVIALLVDRLQRQRVNLDLQVQMLNNMMFDTEAQRRAEVDAVQAKIRDVDAKIGHIRERVQHNTLCHICYETADNQTVTKCCQNTFCFRCIHMWLDMGRSATCPLCKAALRQEDLLVVCPTGERESAARNADAMAIDRPSDERVHPSFDKIKNLEILLRGKPDAKVLIFSAHDFTFSTIEPVLTRIGKRYASIKGNGSQIQATINRYKGTDLDVLLVNSRNYGSGLNLENTTDIIMFHKMDSQVENQVIGRAQRAGRTQSLNVYFLLHDNEVPAGGAS